MSLFSFFASNQKKLDTKSKLGLQILYDLLNKGENFIPERENFRS